ncbi:MAG: hypothetical protein WCK65_08375 [Rhodospirillaceae bacterium]
MTVTFFRALVVSLVMALVMAVALPVAKVAAEQVRTDPHHMRAPPDDVSGYDRQTPQRWYRPALVALRAKTEWRKAGKVDRDLSNACAAGRFKEVSPMQYRAIYSDDVLGVAFGHGLNLFDPERKAKPGSVYLFRFGGSTACQVLTTKNLDPASAQ